ncbi:MAG TPA: EAL domain-containing protein [Actinomycetes bacterium]|nr:EAL domain-containing protein [Actinomycetes bacterium]
MTFLRSQLSKAEWTLFAAAGLGAVISAAELAADPVTPSSYAVVLAAVAGTLGVLLAARRAFLRWRSGLPQRLAWGLICAGLVLGVGFGGVFGLFKALWPLTGASLEGDHRVIFATSGIGALAAIAVGLLSFTWVRTHGLGRALTWLDGLVVTAAVYLMARQLFAAPYALPLDDLMRLLIRPPAAAAALVVVSVVVVSRAREPGGAAIKELLLAASGAAVLGSVMALLYAPNGAAAEGWYWLSPPGAVVGCLLVTAASVRPPELEGAPELRLREHTSVLAPVLPLALAFTVVTWHVANAQTLTPVSTVLAVALMASVVLTTAVARMHALSVARTLEVRVAERTLALGSRERWFRGLVQHSSDVITVVDRAGTINYQTPSVESVFGYLPAQLVGQSLTTLLRRDDISVVLGALERAATGRAVPRTLQFPLRRADGEWIDVETTITSLLDEPDVQGLVLNTRDITERLRLEEELTHRAYSDSLTGLANRSMFRRSVDESLRRSTGGEDVAVVFLDLDGFKSVNDSRGHATGDVLLTHVAVRLRNCVRPGDLIARLGGDEFGILVVGERAEEGAVWIAQRIVAALRDAFTIEQRTLHVGASIGIAVNDSGDEGADQMLRNADLAMYRAKSDSRSAYVRFEADMHRALVQRVQDENDLRRALTEGQLVLHYQPIVSLEADRIVGVEALVRWEHPERGLLPPYAFIDLAEETGLIEPLGAWVLDEATRQVRRWHDLTDDETFRVAVNVSARQFSPEFGELVAAALEREALPGGSLTLEITESVLVEHEPGTMDLMHHLRSLGAQIAVDDFGTGYSSLSYLARFPVDILKVDRAFVRHIGTDAEQAELARTIIQLGRSLNLVTVAEGIETCEQLAGLRELGCHFGQGYFFSHPVPAEEIDELLEAAKAAGGVSRVATRVINRALV